jgi:hypothetical protein
MFHWNDLINLFSATINSLLMILVIYELIIKYTLNRVFFRLNIVFLVNIRSK